jgi:hypothetical protein
MFNNLNLIALLILIFLIIAVLIYTYAGLKFSLIYRKRRGLAGFFLTGVCIGIIGGFIVFYNLKITKSSVYFTIQFERWWIVTILSILIGGIISFIIYKKVNKK